MMKAHIEQMKIEYQELYDISVQIRKVEEELKEIHSNARRAMPRSDVLHFLNKAEEEVAGNRSQVVRLSMALERIMDCYCNTEIGIEQLLDEDSRKFRVAEIKIVDFGVLKDRILQL